MIPLKDREIRTQLPAQAKRPNRMYNLTQWLTRLPEQDDALIRDFLGLTAVSRQ
jgi:hypothetical protein